VATPGVSGRRREGKLLSSSNRFRRVEAKTVKRPITSGKNVVKTEENW
jgi:hypothetical protein